MMEISISAYQIGKHFKIISIQYGQGGGKWTQSSLLVED